MLNRDKPYTNSVTVSPLEARNTRKERNNIVHTMHLLIDITGYFDVSHVPKPTLKPYMIQKVVLMDQNDILAYQCTNRCTIFPLAS